MKLSDQVIARIAQVVQESMLTMTDCVDHLRMIDMEPSKEDPEQLVMTEGYKERVRKMHESMVKEALERKNLREKKDK